MSTILPFSPFPQAQSLLSLFSLFLFKEVTYPHDEHPYEHKAGWHHILEDPRPYVSHEVQTSLVQQSY